MDEEKPMTNLKTKYLKNQSDISVSSDMELGDLLQKLLNTYHLLIYEIERIVLCKGEEQLFSFGDDDHPYSTNLSDIELSGDEQIEVIPANKADRNNSFIDRFIAFERAKADEKLAREMQQEMYYSDGNGEYGDVYNRLLDRASHRRSRPPYFMGRENPSLIMPRLNSLFQGGGVAPVSTTSETGGTTDDGISSSVPVGTLPPLETLPPSVTAQNPFTLLGEIFRQGFNPSDALPAGFSYSFTETLPDNSTVTVEGEVEPVDSDDDLPPLEDGEDNMEDSPSAEAEVEPSLTMPNLTTGASRYSRIMDAVLALSGMGGAPPPSGPLPQVPQASRFVPSNRLSILNYLAGARRGIPRGFADPVKVTLTDDEFNSLESVVFGTVKDTAKSHSCAICMCDYEDDESVLKLPSCEHLFHKECIGEWLKKSSTKCPVCKAVVAAGKPNL